MAITLGSLNEDSLQDAAGEDKPEEVSSSLLTSVTTQEQDKDLSVFEEQSPLTTEDNQAPQASKLVFERSLSEDLLATGEEHFKASYTDDDDEDHITVTLSNVISPTPPPYASSAGYSGSSSTLLAQEANSRNVLEEEQHNFDSSVLDYSDDGPWG
ncbi:unnamed protein product [Candidula unifasciata]|uniref:Uncharacterized protein n=1 Tax=Candidula unifasciata TaxID=100452 RepID=A0A8S3YX76_9EUPU|nr:unnamed protein product [Candidula unifasciata]